MRPIDADALVKILKEWPKHLGILINASEAEYAERFGNLEALAAILGEVERLPTIDAVPVVHYKDTNTTVLNVKSIEDWQDRIILDEGEESRSSAVYYTDSDDMVRVVRCKDCRYSEPMKKHGVYKFGESSLNCTQCRGDDGYGYAGISVVWPDDYCSDGALKDEEEATK